MTYPPAARETPQSRSKPIQSPHGLLLSRFVTAPIPLVNLSMDMISPTKMMIPATTLKGVKYCFPLMAFSCPIYFSSFTASPAGLGSSTASTSSDALASSAALAASSAFLAASCRAFLTSFWIAVSFSLVILSLSFES